MPSYELDINGERLSVDAPADMPLLWALRDRLGLTGTKFGCGRGLCGACTVHVNGQAVRSCLVPVSSVAGGRVATIEGLGPTHPVVRAWAELSVPQCGYCQPGQMMSAAALLARLPAPDTSAIVAAMNGNLCRCGTYLRIRRAVARAAELAAADDAP